MKLSQDIYAETVLKKFNMILCNGIETLLEANVLLRNPSEEKVLENIPYQEVFGSVIHSMLGTRLDHAFAAGL